MAYAFGKPETLTVTAAARLMGITTYKTLALAAAGKVEVVTADGLPVMITRESAERLATVMREAGNPLTKRRRRRKAETTGA